MRCRRAHVRTQQRRLSLSLSLSLEAFIIIIVLLMKRLGGNALSVCACVSECTYLSRWHLHITKGSPALHRETQVVLRYLIPLLLLRFRHWLCRRLLAPSSTAVTRTIPSSCSVLHVRRTLLKNISYVPLRKLEKLWNTLRIEVVHTAASQYRLHDLRITRQLHCCCLSPKQLSRSLLVYVLEREMRRRVDVSCTCIMCNAARSMSMSINLLK